jgi:peptide/nickel transport system substrate-binding protein
MYAIVAVAIVIIAAGSYMIYQQGLEKEKEKEAERERWETWSKTLFVGTTAAIDNPDPFIGSSQTDSYVSYQQHDKLWRTDFSDVAKVNLEIAESWELKYTEDDEPYLDVKIREGLVFQDGTPVDAEAVRFSTEQRWKIEEQGRWWIESSFKGGWEGLEVVDTYRLFIHLNDAFLPHPVIGYIGVLGGTPIYSPTSIEKYGEGEKIVGSGPFKLVEYIPGERVVLEAWKDYVAVNPDRGVPKVDKLVFILYADPSSMRMALEKGEIDIALKDLPPSDVAALMENPDIVVETTPSGYARYMVGNWDMEPWSDVRVRKAVAYALDPEEWIEKTQYGLSEIAHSKVHPWMPYYSDIFYQMYRSAPMEERIEKAKELLAEAGYSEGECELDLYISPKFEGLVVEQEIATIVSAQLAKAGIKVNINPIEHGIWLDMVKARGEMPLTMAGWKFDWPDPDSTLVHCMQLDAGAGAPGRALREYHIDSPRAQELLDLGRELYDPTKTVNPEREAVYLELQEMYADQVFGIPLHFKSEYEIYRTWVKDYSIWWTGYHHAFTEATKEIPAEYR